MKAWCCLKRHKFRLFLCRPAAVALGWNNARARSTQTETIWFAVWVRLLIYKAELPALDNEIVSGNEETAITPDGSHRWVLPGRTNYFVYRHSRWLINKGWCTFPLFRSARIMCSQMCSFRTRNAPRLLCELKTTCRMTTSNLQLALWISDALKAWKLHHLKWHTTVCSFHATLV
jgi:hypothetical protein